MGATVLRRILRVGDPNTHRGASYTLAYYFLTAVCIQETLGDEGWSTISVLSKEFDPSHLHSQWYHLLRSQARLKLFDNVGVPACASKNIGSKFIRAFARVSTQ